MAGQETLIYIDENDQLDAGISAKNYAKEDTQNRAYYNTLGAKLVKKYLASENVDVSNIFNIHTSRKILEELDISDVMLENIHIDVRVVFNENFIFIPKSHFDYEILPDIYLVLMMSNDKKYMKFLGFFEPKLINKNNQNEDYYFIEKEKLTSAINLKDFIENFNGNTAQKLSQSAIEQSDMMILSLADNDIDNQSKKQLLKNLVKSAELRDRFIEFENFELLAYKAQHSPEVMKSAEFDITFDKAATATAKALEKYNASTTSTTEISSSETDIMNSFNDLERNIPDLTPEDTTLSESKLFTDELSTLSDLPDFPDFEDLTVAEAAETSINPNNEPNPETDKITDLEIIKDIADETVEELKTTDTADETPVSFDDFVPLDLNTQEDNATSEILDLDAVEIPLTDTLDTVEILSDTSDLDETLTSEATNISGEIINFEDMPQKIEIKKEEDTKTTETVDFEDISTSYEPAEQISTDETTSETFDFEDIAKTEEDNLSVGFDEEPALNLENFENLSLDETSVETSKEISETDLNTEELNTDEIETSKEFQNEPEMFINETLNEDLSFDTDLTLDEEPLNQTRETKQEKQLSIEEELGIDETTTAENENVILDSIENLMLEDEKAHSPKESDIAAVDEDKELDLMLDMENLTPENAAPSLDDKPETLVEDEKTTADADEIAELNLEADEVQKSTTSDEIEINDFKELGIGVEELPSNNESTEVETNDLISQIDDLLGSSEITNETEENRNSDDDKLEILFSSGEVHNSENVISSMDEKYEEDFSESPEISQNSISGQSEKGKKAIIVAGALVALLAVAGGAGMFLKNKNTASDMISQNPIENDTVNLPQAGADPTAPADNTDLMTNASSGAAEKQKPANPTPPAPAAKTNKNVSNKPADAQTSKPKPTGTPLPYVSVKSIVWEVPDYLSYSDKVKKYLQSAGKSIRLSLSSDLLLADEYAYSNQVKVELKLKNDGTVESAQITKSSGSNQINDIVLRTVKSTLKVVKPAPGEIPTANFKLGLIINL